MTTLNSRLQLAMLNRKKTRNAIEKGFTLVELMIVIVIVGVLSAVALPNFLNQRDKAEAQALIGSMAAFGKQCGANMLIEDPADLPDVPDTIKIDGVAEGTNKPCDGSAVVEIENATAFGRPTNIGGVKCGEDPANGEDEDTCTLDVDNLTGSVSGEWS
ncbi:type IV pilin protein [Synechococcus sp. MIT S9504]|uniref:type IV pilin protein n=1 Tax=Synechococcus sp. MIT S9504 TaxID=1801628 RepID=UPI0007BC1E9A|nr:type II secretion system protein [Synechococcus sp. MIT S9504]KZR84541.1 Fimbrial protein precursor [Synechococcus sp. MIT S9504]